MAKDQTGQSKAGSGWHGDSQGHAQAGSQSSGNSNAAENLTDEDRSKGGAVQDSDSNESQDTGKRGGSH